MGTGNDARGGGSVTGGKERGLWRPVSGLKSQLCIFFPEPRFLRL